MYLCVQTHRAHSQVHTTPQHTIPATSASSSEFVSKGNFYRIARNTHTDTHEMKALTHAQPHVHTHAIYGEIVNENTNRNFVTFFIFIFFNTGPTFPFFEIFTFHKRCTQWLVHSASDEEVAAAAITFSRIHRLCGCVNMLRILRCTYIYRESYSYSYPPPIPQSSVCAHLAHDIFCLSAWTHVVCVRVRVCLAWIMEFFKIE